MFLISLTDWSNYRYVVYIKASGPSLGQCDFHTECKIFTYLLCWFCFGGNHLPNLLSSIANIHEQLSCTVVGCTSSA